ncbi:P-loop NTPase fold protein [Spiroplasma endosymbiont of Polydrusus pterygomalis]|uniref:P-loop NTPase fold protein n=1 Tax=Spiroplasma endosymbiont of Polydrusus pterygomalis TaxID=3139327 RepID=UPI003CCAA9B6
MKKKNEIKELQEKNKKDDFVNYNHAIEEITLKINDLFKHQNNTRYTTNILIIKGEYGTGKTFIMSEVLKKFEKNEQSHSYYIDLSTIESQSRTDFSKYLFNEISKCISYQKYLQKLFKLKFFKIFAKKLPFNFVEEEIKLKIDNDHQQILIVLDEIDRCEPDNIISTFTILKNHCLNITNVVFIIILNEKVIKPIVEDYFKIPKENIEHYQLFLEKITSNSIEISNFVNYQFYNLKILKDNKILQCSKDETNKYINKKIKIRNQRHILRIINDKASWQKILKDKYLLELEKENSKKMTSVDAALFEIIQYFTMLSILLNKIPNKINDLTLSNVSIINIPHHRSPIRDKLLTLHYSNFFTLKNEKIEEMNFLDFYFIKNTKTSFNLHYIDMRNVNSYSQEIEIVKQILNNIYQIHKKSGSKSNIVLILEDYNIKKYKIIFDLPKSNLLNFNNDEDIWIKLSEIKTSNKILDHYDETIHDYIINLLKNNDWENNYQNLKTYLSKIEKEIENVA